MRCSSSSVTNATEYAVPPTRQAHRERCRGGQRIARRTTDQDTGQDDRRDHEDGRQPGRDQHLDSRICHRGIGLTIWNTPGPVLDLRTERSSPSISAVNGITARTTRVSRTRSGTGWPPLSRMSSAIRTGIAAEQDRAG